MSEFILPSIKPHLLTSNIYVRKNIVVNNIKSLDKLLNQKVYKEFGYSAHFKIVNLKKLQLSFLKSINSDIKKLEQNSFPFGGLSSL